MHITSAQFIKSASTLSQCPPPHYPEFAFFGRSNVGKSSLINKLTQRNSLAKTSNIPGKTRLLNFFLINEQWQIVDLP
jgi:GTP-binding protein